MYIYICKYCLHIHVPLCICLVSNFCGDATVHVSCRYCIFALHRSHGSPMPKKVTSNRSLEQWFAFAMVTLGQYGMPILSIKGCVKFVSAVFWLVDLVAFLPNMSNRLLKTILTTLDGMMAPCQSSKDLVGTLLEVASSVLIWWNCSESLRSCCASQKLPIGGNSFLCVRSTAD